MASTVSRVVERTIPRGSPSYPKRDLVSYLLPEPTQFVSLPGDINRATQGLWGYWGTVFRLLGTGGGGTSHYRSPISITRAGFVAGNQNRYTTFNTDVGELGNSSRRHDQLFSEQQTLAIEVRHNTENITGNNNILPAIIVNIANNSINYFSGTVNRIPSPFLYRVGGQALTKSTLYFLRRDGEFASFSNSKVSSSSRWTWPSINTGTWGLTGTGSSGSNYYGDISRYSKRFFMRSRVLAFGFLHYRFRSWNRDDQAQKYILKTALRRNSSLK